MEQEAKSSLRDLIGFFLHLLSYIKQECFRVSKKRSMSLNLLTLQDRETFLLKFRKKNLANHSKILQADTGKMGAGVKRTKEKENEVFFRMKTYYQYVFTVHVSYL